METRAYLQQWATRYRDDLTTNIMPFWLENGLDKKHGGIFTCLNRDGSLMDTTKSVWFQGRFAYVCAFAYNTVEKRQEYLDAARSAIDFIEKYCFDNDGHMYFSVTADGRPLRKRRYVFSETFAAIAMSEYAVATGDKHYAKRALQIFDDTLRFLNTPGYLAPKFEPEVQLQGHSIVMILINVCSCLRKAIDDPKLTAQIDESIMKLEKYFIHPEFKCLLETDLTRTINPGHCIETAWFILEEARHRGWDKHLTELGLKIFDWSFEWGWDEPYGGIINFRDCRNLPPQDYSQDMKFWWPQCETIIASLYAYLATGDEKYIERHKQISDWAYKHLPDPEGREWFGYLHRDGTAAQMAKGNLYKGPFHIPRMMAKSFTLCNEILSK